jgi:hypothetical protein
MPAAIAKHPSDPQTDPTSGVFSPPCAPGDVIQEKYRIERLVGSGGMAWVFEATHLVLQHGVALKVLRIDTSADNTEALTRFEREARAAAAVSGEATARVMDTGTLDDGSPFLVMELLEGRDLDSIASARRHLPIPGAVNYVLQACEGVAETHAAGIVHRDLKPSNLFITQASDGSVRVKLLDFGISKITGPSAGPRVTATRALVGSPVYMSPEQMRSSRDIDGRTDIWSLGVILYELLADGRSPFDASTLPAICAHVLDSPPPPLRKIRHDVPRGLERVVLRCLEKDPDRRYQTAADLAFALARFGPADAYARARRVRRILEGSAVAMRTAVSRPRSRWPLTAIAVSSLLVLAGVLLLHPSYGGLASLAGRAWTHWTLHAAQTMADAVHEPPPPPPPAPESLSVPQPEVAAPVIPASEPPSLAPEAKVSPRSVASTVAAAGASDAASQESIAMLLAQARGELPPVDALTTKSARARGTHRWPHAGKHYVAEQTPSPDPAPPILVPAPASAASPASHPDRDPNPYDDNVVAVPDLGPRN